MSRPDLNKIAKASGDVDLANALAPAEGLAAKAQREKEEDEALANKDDEPEYRIPPETAIAGVLIKHWASGGLDFKESFGKSQL